MEPSMYMGRRVVHYDDGTSTTVFDVTDYDEGNDFEPDTVSGEIVKTDHGLYDPGDFYTAPVEEVRTMPTGSPGVMYER